LGCAKGSEVMVGVFDVQPFFLNRCEQLVISGDKGQ
jgi:hypothetical protein